MRRDEFLIIRRCRLSFYRFVPSEEEIVEYLMRIFEIKEERNYAEVKKESAK